MKIVWKSKLHIDENTVVHACDFYENLFRLGVNGSEIVTFYSSMDLSSKPPYDCYINAAAAKK